MLCFHGQKEDIFMILSELLSVVKILKAASPCLAGIRYSQGSCTKEGLHSSAVRSTKPRELGRKFPPRSR